MGLWYSKDSGFELIAYVDADHAWCNDDCKSTSRGIQFLRDRIRKEETTPREQRHARRDKVREAKNKLRKKDRTINQKHAKKREREVEVESVKEVLSSKTTRSGLKRDVIGVADVIGVP
nr:uncharacterized mitochondrial protein AtMg00810-like [Tanacetum cinerariifolium]